MLALTDEECHGEDGYYSVEKAYSHVWTPDASPLYSVNRENNHLISHRATSDSPNVKSTYIGRHEAMSYLFFSYCISAC